MLMLMAVTEKGGGTLRHRGEREEPEVSQQLGIGPWEGLFLLRNYCLTVNAQRGHSQHCLRNPKFWVKDPFQRARPIPGSQRAAVNIF